MKKFVAAVVVLGLTLVGCSSGSKYNQPDAPRGKINSGVAEIVAFPDGFSNVATKCDHGHRIYVLFHGDSPSGSVFAIDDPTCAG